MKHEVRKICSVCKVDWKADEPGLKTHGYCPPCGKAEMEKLEGVQNAV